MTNFHLSQTISSKKNLIKEGIKKNIFVVGNPGIDYFLDYLKKTDLKKLSQNEFQATDRQLFYGDFYGDDPGLHIFVKPKLK